MKYQRESEERFFKWEEERLKKEYEMEKVRRKEERDHEVRVLQMIGQMQQSNYTYPPYDTPF